MNGEESVICRSEKRRFPFEARLAALKLSIVPINLSKVGLPKHE